MNKILHLKTLAKTDRCPPALRGKLAYRSRLRHMRDLSLRPHPLDIQECVCSALPTPSTRMWPPLDENSSQLRSPPHANNGKHPSVDPLLQMVSDRALSPSHIGAFPHAQQHLRKQVRERRGGFCSRRLAGLKY